ncbi:MAG: hypothetical protein SFZ03_09460 [Candidatus Melainabacteria bacterium]|nr:hypothetical protein [Candidatus Melainabacteria bacterium]
MTKPNLANCRRCGKIFQKVMQDRCTDCFSLEHEHFTILFRCLQASETEGGIEIDQLAEQTDISVEQIEQYYMEGRLGTASCFLKFKCQSCGKMLTNLQRQGRHCVNCNENFAKTAGVSIRDKQTIEKEEAKERRMKASQEFLAQRRQSSSAAGRDASRRFGFHQR